jgi:alkylation response protein AidB-like acyl-CoA dehydrogenase
MEFAFTEEQQMIGETARSFFAENATSDRTRKAMAGDGIDRALWQSFCSELGLAGIALPEAHGGAGLGMVEFALVAEAAGAQVAAIPLLGHAMVTRALAAGGSAEQKAELLPRLIAGELIGTGAWAPKVSASGDILSGTVEFLAHGASADLFILLQREQLWLVERDMPGVTITAHTTMDQTRPLATLRLENVKGAKLADPQAALADFHVAGWICLAAEALGGAQACLDRTIAYAKERVQFGRTIGSFQAYKHRLADMAIEVEQARSAVYWAACAVDEESEEAPLALHAAKSFAADTFFMCASNMIQLHGGIGFTWEHDAHLYFKRARSIQTLLANGNWHREQIANMIVGEAA